MWHVLLRSILFDQGNVLFENLKKLFIAFLSSLIHWTYMFFDGIAPKIKPKSDFGFKKATDFYRLYVR